MKHDFNHIFAGVTPFTLIDYPGELAAVFFVRGCPLRCRYCHNPSLLADYDLKGNNELADAEVVDFLNEKAGKLTGIVLSGGDPLDRIIYRRPDILDFVKMAHDLGYKVKLDTNGVSFNRGVLAFDTQLDKFAKDIIHSFDAFGLDIKAPEDKYDLFGASWDDVQGVHYFIDAVLAHGAPLELRTTVHRSLLTFEDLVRIETEFIERHALDHKIWVLQQFHKGELRDNTINNEPTYTDEELKRFAAELGCRVRGIKED